MSGGAVADQKGHVIGLVSAHWVDDSAPFIPGLLEVAPAAMIRHFFEDRMGATVLSAPPSDRSFGGEGGTE